MKKTRKNIRRKLTDDYIKNLEPPLVKFQTIYDTINLKLLNYKSGGKVFWAWYWFNDKTIYYRLSQKWDYNKFKIADARIEVRQIQSEYIDKGLDPRLVKKQQKLEAYRMQITEAKKMVFKQLVEKYIEAGMPRVATTGTLTHRSAKGNCYLLIGRKRTSKLKFYDDAKGNGIIVRRDSNLRSWDDFWAHNRSEKSNCAYDSVIGQLFVEDVRKTKIKNYINKFTSIEQRRNNKTAISIVISWAIDNEYFGDDPPTNPCFDIPIKRKGQQEKTKRKIKTYTPDELRRIWEACDDLIDKFPFQTTVIKLLSVTSLRKNEALKMRKDYIKDNDGLIELPYELTKIRMNQDIDINPQIQLVLDELKMLRKKYPWSNFLPWCFPTFRVRYKNTRPSYSKVYPHKSHLQDVRNCWEQIKLLAKVDGDTGRFKKTHHNLAKQICPNPYDLIDLTRHTNTAVLEKSYLTQDLEKRKANSQKLGVVYADIFRKKAK